MTHRVSITNSEDGGYAVRAVEWCHDHCAAEDYDIALAWPAQQVHFDFQDPAKAMVFKLRWAG